ncbi:MAG: ABC transporter ATP-binding protein [Halarcobacter ebronensis]|uniref:ABC transporter ATP-binding protein n=1 Tax=Halarcobacter ebronensis TaxID=1462615 RepID=UPI003C7256DE
MVTFKQIMYDSLKILSKNEKKSFIKLSFLVLVMSLMEVIGIASILPFIKVVTDPNIIFEHKVLNWSYELLMFSSERQFMIVLGLVSFIILLVTNLLSVWTIKKMYTFIYSLNNTLASKLLESYLDKDYIFFVNKNSAELTKNIITEVEQTVVGVFIPFVNLFAKLIMIIFVVSFLLYINIYVTLLVFIVLGGAYFVLFTIIKKRIAQEANNRSLNNNLRYKATNEAFGAIKEIKMIGKEELFLDKFKRHSKIYASSMAHNAILGLIPKYMMEILAFGGIILSVVYLLLINKPIQNYIPIMSVFIFAGYRMMPAMQQVFASLTKIRFSYKALYNLLDDYSIIQLPKQNANGYSDEIIKKIQLKGISFSYKGLNNKIINNFNIILKTGDKVALIGPTGSGKTTLVDILLGLYSPLEGEVIINNKEVDNMNIWKDKIAYVPQFNYLLDDSVYANIAFGEKNIDKEKVFYAAKLACVDDVIENLENGYETIIGERGIKLSGGQRQRLGIARALYRKPQVLVLDEATSALDEVTEKKVMNTIYNMNNTIVVMIAHRLSTIEKANKIIDLGVINANRR